MATRHPSSRRKLWCQESANKNISKKKPMASRIRQEDIEEETNGIKTPAEKKQQEETQPRVVN